VTGSGFRGPHVNHEGGETVQWILGGVVQENGGGKSLLPGSEERQYVTTSGSGGRERFSREPIPRLG